MRVTIPEKGTYIDFPDDMDREAIKRFLDTNWDSIEAPKRPGLLKRAMGALRELNLPEGEAPPFGAMPHHVRPGESQPMPALPEFITGQVERAVQTGSPMVPGYRPPVVLAESERVPPVMGQAPGPVQETPEEWATYTEAANQRFMQAEAEKRREEVLGAPWVGVDAPTLAQRLGAVYGPAWQHGVSQSVAGRSFDPRGQAPQRLDEELVSMAGTMLADLPFYYMGGQAVRSGLAGLAQRQLANQLVIRGAGTRLVPSLAAKTVAALAPMAAGSALVRGGGQLAQELREGDVSAKPLVEAAKGGLTGALLSVGGEFGRAAGSRLGSTAADKLAGELLGSYAGLLAGQTLTTGQPPSLNQAIPMAIQALALAGMRKAIEAHSQDPNIITLSKSQWGEIDGGPQAPPGPQPAQPRREAAAGSQAPPSGSGSQAPPSGSGSQAPPPGPGPQPAQPGTTTIVPPSPPAQPQATPVAQVERPIPAFYQRLSRDRLQTYADRGNEYAQRELARRQAADSQEIQARPEPLVQPQETPAEGPILLQEPRSEVPSTQTTPEAPEAPPEQPESSEQPDYSKMTIPQLARMIGERGLQIPDDAKRSDLVKLLEDNDPRHKPAPEEPPRDELQQRQDLEAELRALDARLRGVPDEEVQAVRDRYETDVLQFLAERGESRLDRPHDVPPLVWEAFLDRLDTDDHYIHGFGDRYMITKAGLEEAKIRSGDISLPEPAAKEPQQPATDYSKMTVPQLAEELKRRGIRVPKGKRQKKKRDLIKLLEYDDEVMAPEPPAGEQGPPVQPQETPEGPDYSKMTVPQLNDEFKKRGIPRPRGKKADLVAALEDDDASKQAPQPAPPEQRQNLPEENRYYRPALGGHSPRSSATSSAPEDSSAASASSMVGGSSAVGRKEKLSSSSGEEKPNLLSPRLTSSSVETSGTKSRIDIPSTSTKSVAPEPPSAQPEAEEATPEPGRADAAYGFGKYGKDKTIGDPSEASKDVPLKKQKSYLLERIDDAIAEAPEKKQLTEEEQAKRNEIVARGKFGESELERFDRTHADTVTIYVPGDGDFTVENTKNALQKFRQRMQKQFPEGPDRVPKPSVPRGSVRKPPKLGSVDATTAPKTAALYVSKDPGRKPLHDLYSDGNALVATDGRRMIIIDGDFGGTKEKPLRLSAAGKPTSGEHAFPAYRDVVPTDSALAFEGIDTGELFSVSRQALALSKGTKFPGLRIYRNPDGSMGARSLVPEEGEYTHNLQDGAEFLVEMNASYANDVAVAARNLGAERIDMLTTATPTPSGHKPVVFRSPGVTQVVLPMRQDEDTPEPPTRVHRGAVPAVVETEQEAQPVSDEPETTGGKILINRLKNDKKQRVGLRSISEYVVNLVHARMMVGKTQTSKRHPAHFSTRGALIRSRSGSWQLNFHEAGHGLSQFMEDKAPRWLASQAAALEGLTQAPGSMASKGSAEEGLAELVRRYITNPQSLPEALVGAFEGAMDKHAPDALVGLRDARRAYQYHRSRPITEQLMTMTRDRGPRPALQDRAQQFVLASLYNVFGGFPIVHDLQRRIFEAFAPPPGRTRFGGQVKAWMNKAYRTQLAHARQFERGIAGTTADFENAYAARKRVPGEVARAMHGEGLRVYVPKGQADSKLLAKLAEAGFDINPDTFPFGGGYLNLADPIAKVREGIGEGNWEEFCAYGQYRAALARWNAKQHEYPGMSDGLTPEILQKELANVEAEHPDWDGHFKAINQYCDQLLVVTALSGEMTPGELRKIKGAYDDYWPLPRQLEGTRMRTQGGGADPSSGIRRAFGSPEAFQSLDEALATRTRMVLQSYYENRIRVSVKNALLKASKSNDIPYEARMDLQRTLMPLHLETQKVATLSEWEMNQVIADYFNEQLQDNAELQESVANILGVETTRIGPQHIDYSPPGMEVWRPVKPNAIRVISMFENGHRTYYQVTDPVLYELFAQTKRPGEVTRWLETLGTGVVAPWKRLLTQNVAFAARNIVRDMFTAWFRGDSWVPFMQAAHGVMGRLKGRQHEMATVELFSRAAEVTSAPAHQRLVGSFYDRLRLGLTSRQPFGSALWFAEQPGRLSAALAKPLEMLNWMTGGPAVSEASEMATREGAHHMARDRGTSLEAAQMASEQVTGDFGEQPGSPELAALFRAAGFVNPGLRILFSIGEQFGHRDPGVRFRSGAKLAWIAAISGVAAALNLLLRRAGKDDEEWKRLSAELKERPDKDRLAYMHLPGGVRFPFDNGLIGACASYGWNTAEEWLLDDPITSVSKGEELLRRARDIPGLTDMVPPHLKTWMEMTTNYSFFWGENIVPPWMEAQYPPEKQAWPETPEVYKKLGEATKTSPIKLEYMTRQLLTRQMTDVVRLVDRAAQGRKPVESAKDVPILSALAAPEPTGFRSQSVQTAAELERQYQQVRDRVKELNAQGKDTREVRDQMHSLSRAHSTFNAVQRLFRQVKEERRSKTPDLERIRALERQMTELAQNLTDK